MALSKRELLVAGVAATFIGAVFLFSNAIDDDGGDQGPTDGETLVDCRNAVKEQVVNPDTIDWHSLDTTITDTSISGTFDAQNDFGAVKSMRYTCTVEAGTVVDSTVTEG